MAKFESLNSNFYASFQNDNNAYQYKAGQSQTTPIYMAVGGIYRSSLPTYTNGDAAMMHFTSDGKLMVDTELTLDGNVIIDNIAVWATDIADSSTAGFALIDAAGHPQVDVMTTGASTAYNNTAYGETEDEAQASEFATCGIYGYDSEGSANSRLRALQIAVDNAGISATPNVAIVGGAYKAALDTYNNDDAVPFHFDDNGRLITAVDGSLGLPVTHRNPQDFSAAYTSNVTITLSGAPFTVADANCFIAYIYYRPTGSDWATPLINGVEGVSFTSAANVITVAGAGTPFASSDEYLVGIIYQEKAYNSALDAMKMTELSPVSDHYAGQTLAAVTDGEDDTYYYYLDMAGYKFPSWQFILSGGSGTATVTIEASLQDDGTAAASCTYVDVSSSWFGAANWTATNILEKDTPTMAKFVRIKIVAATGDADDADWTVFAREGY